jgi:hypothetical protein
MSYEFKYFVFGTVTYVVTRTPMAMNITVFRDITPCSLVNRYQRFEGTRCHHLQGRKISQAAMLCYLLLNGYLLGLLFDRGDGGIKFLRNVRELRITRHHRRLLYRIYSNFLLMT